MGSEEGDDKVHVFPHNLRKISSMNQKSQRPWTQHQRMSKKSPQHRRKWRRQKRRMRRKMRRMRMNKKNSKFSNVNLKAILGLLISFNAV